MGNTERDFSTTEHMQVELESLKQFEQDILKVLADLTGGSVNPTDPLEGHLQWADFGSIQFHEAQALGIATWATVTRIQDLAKALHTHIEAMALSVRIAGDATAAADDSVQRRMAEMLAELGGAVPTAGSGTSTGQKPSGDDSMPVR